eukprot:scaffold2062_cov181-Ochromonas_danica.AAC.14
MAQGQVALVEAAAGSPQQVVRIIGTINSHLLFIGYLSKLFSFYAPVFDRMLPEDKVDLLASRYQQNLLAGQFEAIAKAADLYNRIVYNDCRKIMENCFFHQAWEEDITGIVALKRLLKSRTSFLRKTIVLYEEIQSSGGGEHGMGNNQLIKQFNTLFERYGLTPPPPNGTTGAGVNIVQELMLVLTLRSVEGSVKAYLEQLLLSFGNGLISQAHSDSYSNAEGSVMGDDSVAEPAAAVGVKQSSGGFAQLTGLLSSKRNSFSTPPANSTSAPNSSSTPTSRNSYAYFYNLTSSSSSSKTFRQLNVGILHRLNEDLQLLLALAEDLRLLASIHPTGDQVHVIQTRKKAFLRPLRALKEKMKRFKVESPDSSTVASIDDDDSVSVSTSGGGAQGASSSFNNKQIFDLAMQVLQHFIYAVQMHKQYLPAFVKDCFVRDFGPTVACKLYVFLMYWRGETAETIKSDYDANFVGGMASQHSDNVLCSLPLIHSIKAANVIKL